MTLVMVTIREALDGAGVMAAAAIETMPIMSRSRPDLSRLQQADTDGTDDNVNGALRIVANKTGNEITSARIKSDIGEIGSTATRSGANPRRVGAWPAIWLLGRG